MLSTIFYAIAYLLIAAALIFGIVLILKRAKNGTRSMIKAVFKHSKILQVSALFFAVLVCLIYTAGTAIDVSRHASAIITLNYAEASLGQNANGTRYNMSEVICREVLERTIYKGGYENLTANDLESCFTIEPLIEGNSYSESGYHISTEFLVKYTANKKTQQYDSDTMVELLCNAYRDYYLDMYMSDFIFSNDDFKSEIAGLDYYDKALFLDKETDRILNYLYGLQSQNSSFVSSDGATFGSVTSKVYNLRKSQIDGNLNAFILQNGLSDDPDLFLERLQYLNKQASFRRDKLYQSYTITNAAVLRYDEDMARVVLVPTWDLNGEYYMSRTKIGIDELSKQSKSYSQELASVEKTMDTNQLKIQKFRPNAGNTEENRKLADEYIDSIRSNIMKFSREARNIGQEYYANQLNHCISVSVNHSSLLSNKGMIVLTFVLGYIAYWIFNTGRKFSNHAKIGE